MSQRLVPATSVSSWCALIKKKSSSRYFFAKTGRITSNRLDFMRQVSVTKSRRGDNNFYQKRYLHRERNRRCDQSRGQVAATCSIVCADINGLWCQFSMTKSLTKA